MTEPDHRQYFATKVGRWWSPFRFELTDVARLMRSQIRWTEKLSLILLNFVTRRWFYPVIKTSVDCSRMIGHGEVFHTTQLSVLNITLFKSAETIKLGSDGQSFDVFGHSRIFPFVGSGAEWKGTGTVADDHDGAVYQLPWLGLMLEQSTRMTSDGLEFLHSTSYSQATFVLKPE